VITKPLVGMLDCRLVVFGELGCGLDVLEELGCGLVVYRESTSAESLDMSSFICYDSY
jgi:hypothetical protein